MKDHIRPYVIKAQARISQAIEKLERTRKREQKAVWGTPLARYAPQLSLTLFVLDRNNRLIGAITDGDVRRALIEWLKQPKGKTEDFASQKVSKIMRRNIFKVREGESLPSVILEARRKMRGVRLIPVVNKKNKIVDFVDLTMFDPRPALDVVVMARPGGRIEERRVTHSTTDLTNHLQKLRSLAELSQDDFMALLSVGELDDYLMALDQGIEFLKEVAKRELEDVTDIANILEEQRSSVLEYSLRYAGKEEIKYFGDPKAVRAFERPDFVFVLGCRNEGERRTRVRHGIKIARKNEKSFLILCGGGWGREESEARSMAKDVPDDLSDRIILEEYSLDTVGNAVFSHLILLERGLLRKTSRVCVVTSDYHAARALRTFLRVFHHRNKIVVAPIPTLDIEMLVELAEKEKADFLDKAARELRGEHLATGETFSIKNYLTGRPDRISRGDVASIFYQMVLQHEQYKFRTDLVRRFSAVL